ncbi:hypothetical protein WKI68_07005 [Streptomyces sp. MS1.HAVA.3]|uniref:Uncharacterized protein n=1 Tax=Streptomyces caledonius TaxID=3134107 RepID=A0ABU8U083_9ACTN
MFVVFNGDGTNGRAAWDGKDLINRIVAALIPESPEGPGGPDAPDGPAPAAPGTTTDPSLDSYTGSYRPARVSRTSLMALEGLVAGVTVEKDGRNGLRTTGLSLDPTSPSRAGSRSATACSGSAAQRVRCSPSPRTGCSCRRRRRRRRTSR